jgi:hypothetical protein
LPVTHLIRDQYSESTVNSKTQPPKNQHPSEEIGNELNREFSKEEVQMSSKYMKKCSSSLVIKEMQIKTTLRFLLTPVRMAIIKGNNNNKCWQGCGETVTIIQFWVGMQNYTTTMESSVEIPKKTRD